MLDRFNATEKYRFAVVILWTLLVAEAAALFLLERPWLAADSQAYVELAQNLAAGRGFVSWAPTGVAPNAIRSPGYPSFLVPFVHFGLPSWSLVAVQVGLYLSALWLVLRFLLISKDVRLAFLLVSVCYVFPLVYSSFILTEAVTIFLVTASFVLATRGNVAAGLVAGLAVLVRGDMLFLSIAAALVIWRRTNWQRGMIALAATAVVVTPYALWNKQTFGKFSPLPAASTIGQSLYIASWESKIELDDLKIVSGGPDTPGAEKSGLASEVRQSEAEAAARAKSGPHRDRQVEIARSSVFMDKAIQRFEADPGDFALHSVKAGWRLFNTSEYGSLPSPIIWGLRLSSGIIWLLGLIGLAIALVNRRNPTLTDAALTLAILLIPHLPLHTEARYTAGLRMLLMLSAAFVLVDLWRRMMWRATGARQPVTTWQSRPS